MQNVKFVNGGESSFRNTKFVAASTAEGKPLEATLEGAQFGPKRSVVVQKETVSGGGTMLTFPGASASGGAPTPRLPAALPFSLARSVWNKVWFGVQAHGSTCGMLSDRSLAHVAYSDRRRRTGPQI